MRIIIWLNIFATLLMLLWFEKAVGQEGWKEESGMTYCAFTPLWSPAASNILLTAPVYNRSNADGISPMQLLISTNDKSILPAGETILTLDAPYPNGKNISVDWMEPDRAYLKDDPFAGRKNEDSIVLYAVILKGIQSFISRPLVIYQFKSSTFSVYNNGAISTYVKERTLNGKILSDSVFYYTSSFCNKMQDISRQTNNYSFKIFYSQFGDEESTNSIVSKLLYDNNIIPTPDAVKLFRILNPNINFNADHIAKKIRMLKLIKLDFLQRNLIKEDLIRDIKSDSTKKLILENSIKTINNNFVTQKYVLSDSVNLNLFFDLNQRLTGLISNNIIINRVNQTLFINSLRLIDSILSLAVETPAIDIKGVIQEMIDVCSLIKSQQTKEIAFSPNLLTGKRRLLKFNSPFTDNADEIIHTQREEENVNKEDNDPSLRTINFYVQKIIPQNARPPLIEYKKGVEKCFYVYCIPRAKFEPYQARYGNTLKRNAKMDDTFFATDRCVSPASVASMNLPASTFYFCLVAIDSHIILTDILQYNIMKIPRRSDDPVNMPKPYAFPIAIQD